MTCEYSSETASVLLRDAVLSDVPKIEALYKKIAVTREHYHRVLDPENGLFSKRGGMFEISSASDIEGRINDANELITVGEVNGEIRSAFWYGIIGRDDFSTLMPSPGMEAEAKIIENGRKNGNIGYAKEIISLRSEASGIMPFILNKIAAEYFLSRGVKYTVCEIFQVDGWGDCDGDRLCALFNFASGNVLTQNGGRYIGNTRQKRVDMTSEGYYALITSRIFLWNNEKIVNNTKEFIEKNGWHENCRTVNA